MIPARLRVAVIGTALGLLAAAAASAAPLGSTFTYQGQLKDGGGPVNDPAMPMSFSLYDAAGGGNLIDVPFATNVAVVDGLFTVELDFGAAAFDGQQRWLEITVDGTALSPRQPMTAAPYALHTRGLAVDNNNGNVGIGGALYAAGILLPGAFGPDSAYVGGPGNYLAFGHTGVSEDFIGYASNTFYLKDSPGGGDSADPSLVVGGDLGVGTDSPSQKLHVIGDALLQGTEGFDEGGDRARLYLGDASNHIDAVQGGGLRFSSFQADDALVVQQGNGYVGIGNSAPGFPLSFASDLGDKISLYGDPGASFGFGIQPGLLQICTNSAISDVAFGYGDSANFTETMRITGYGDVGIGTTSPGARVDARGAGLVNFFAGDLTPFGTAGYLTNFANPAAHAWFAENGARVFSVQSGGDGYFKGYVGIGTDFPLTRLHVNGTARMTGFTMFEGSGAGKVLTSDAGGNGTWQDLLEASLWATNETHIHNANAGNVGIGTASPGAKLHVEGGDVGIFGHGKAGVFGRSDAEDGGLGVVGVCNLGNGVGVYGYSDYATGVEGFSSYYYGIRGACNAYGESGSGVLGSSTGFNGTGVRGMCHSGTQAYGVWGQSDEGYAGYFDGRVHVNGTLSKSGGSFKIDHPMDPENKTLSHSFVESPDMMNVYNGNATTDATGEVWVELPRYFETLNRDFRYQLTVIGQFAQAIVGEEIADNGFLIRTDRPGVKVSWQVTGIRQDPWAEKNRIPVEEDKPEAMRGKYMNPEAYGLPRERGVKAAKEAELEAAPVKPVPPDLRTGVNAAKKAELEAAGDSGASE